MSIGAIASQVVGDVTSEVLNQEAAGDQREFNKQMMHEQNKFQERMSSTAYQRGTQDMIAAGLNPSLMYAKAGGASTPGGGTASSSPGSPSRLGSGIGDTILSSAKNSRDNELAGSQLELNRATKANIAADTIAKNNTAAKTMTEQKLAEATLMAVDPEMRNRKKRAEFESGMQEYDAVSKRVLEGSSILGNVMSVGNYFKQAKDFFNGKKPPINKIEHNYNSQGEHLGTKETRYVD